MIQQNKKTASIDEFIVKWNMDYPWDRMWRAKYGISFGSRAHREMNLLDMFIELREGKVLEELERKHKEELEYQELKTVNETLYEKNLIGNQAPKRGIEMTQKEIDQAYENLDLSKFNDVVL